MNTTDRLVALASSLNWRTSRDGSHQYVHTLKDPVTQPGIRATDWSTFAAVCSQHGRPREFAGRTYRYLRLAGYDYWIMPQDKDADPCRHPLVLNRRRVR